MKNLLSLLCAGACLSLPILMSIGSASAAVPGRGPIVKINGEGFRICRAFDANDTKAWTARANGLLIDGAGNGDLRCNTTNPHDHRCGKWKHQL